MLYKLSQKIKNKLRQFRQQLTPKTWSENSIVYYASDTGKAWTPDNLKVGIGGSQQAAIAICREWAKAGYKVTVFNNCGDLGGVYDGVEYRHFQDFNPYDRFETLVVWRYPWRVPPQIQAKRLYADIHEVLLPHQVTREKLKNYDKIFVKSQWQRQLFPEIPDAQIAVVPNGFDPQLLQFEPVPRQPYKLIYASNYSRGLERMLEFGWPLIREAIPEAELYIYYGWSQECDRDAAWKQKMLALMEQPGVIECGRIGVKKLLREKASSTIHYYGCTFDEIDCISVRESAAVGCIPVTSARSALAEKPYCITVPGNAYQAETQKALALRIVELLNNCEERDRLRPKFQELAHQESWGNVARQWFFQL